VAVTLAAIEEPTVGVRSSKGLDFCSQGSARRQTRWSANPNIGCPEERLDTRRRLLDGAGFASCDMCSSQCSALVPRGQKVSRGLASDWQGPSKKLCLWKATHDGAKPFGLRAVSARQLRAFWKAGADPPQPAKRTRRTAPGGGSGCYASVTLNHGRSRGRRRPYR
jgi:hypothetical protein